MHMYRLVLTGVCLVILAAVGIWFFVSGLKEKAKDKRTLEQLQGLIVQDAENHRLSLSETFVYPMGGFYIALDQASRKMIYRLLPNEEKVLDFSDVKRFSIQDRVEEREELIHQLGQNSAKINIGNAVAGVMAGGAMGAGMIAAKSDAARKPVSEMSSQEIEARLKGQSFLTVLLHLNSGETVTFPMMVHGAHGWGKKNRQLASDSYNKLYILLQKSFSYGTVRS